MSHEYYEDFEFIDSRFGSWKIILIPQTDRNSSGRTSQ
jgi:hypothetical protein